MSDRRGVTIPDVSWGRLVRHADVRGAFRELWRRDRFGPIDPVAAGEPAGSAPGFVQANVSTSSPGVLRGLHLHRRQLDHWIVASGRAFVALVDLRAMLEAGSRKRARAAPERRPAVETRVLAADDTVTIPVGVAHGFLALEPLELVYLVTNAFDGTDELGFAWDDPLAAVPWPVLDVTRDGRPILSERDLANPTLTELVAALRS